MKINITYSDQENEMVDNILRLLAPYITERDRLKFGNGEKHKHAYLTISTPTATNPLMCAE